MIYIFVNNTGETKYPFTLRQFTEQHPNISVPKTPTKEQLEELGLYQVRSTARPQDQIGIVVEEDDPIVINGFWTQQWSTREATAAELVQQQNQLIDSIVAATQTRLDAFAATRGYDDVNSISKYKDISDEEIAAMPANEQPLVTKFRAESRYLASMTARTWAVLYLILDEVQAGTRPVPSGYADIEPLLPPLVWPV